MLFGFKLPCALAVRVSEGVVASDAVAVGTVVLGAVVSAVVSAVAAGYFL